MTADLAALRDRFDRAAANPPLMMLYPPVATGRSYEGTPDAESMWAGAATTGTLYVHVPFCHARCVFCPFHATVASAEEHAAYVNHVLAEARMWATAVTHVQFTSVYFGGGTPSLLGPALIGKLIRELRSCFRMDGADITIEGHPGSVDGVTAPAFAAAGVTRLSLGAQSFDPVVLAAAGRGDTIGRVHAATEAAVAAPFREVNVDLMYSLPEQTDAIWRTDPRTAADLGVPGLTLYGTVYLPQLQTRCESHAYRVAGQDERRAMHETGFESLGAAGYRQPHFGAGAFQRLGPNPHRANLAHGLPTLGIGTWAYSTTAAWAWHNNYPRAEWQRDIARGALPIKQLLAIPEGERARKWVIEALLLAYVDLPVFQAAFGESMRDAFPSEMAVLRDLDLATASDGELRLTRKGGHHLREVRYLFASDDVVAATERAPGL
jgi:oxygen-independent coproporphyrinogen-3 oxidase